jgi:hypothetical protein
MSLNPNQFTDFIKASDLMDYRALDYGTSMNVMKQVGGLTKVDEAKVGNRWVPNNSKHSRYEMTEGIPLYDDIKQHGVKEPITLDRTHPLSQPNKPLIVEGHHRIAVSHDIDPDRMVPVQYRDTPYGPHRWQSANYGIPGGLFDEGYVPISERYKD